MIDDLSHYLPLSLREMASAVGLQPVIELAAWRGGISLYVPHTLSASHPLSDHIGAIAALWLVYNHAGEVINVPRAASYLRGRRDQAIRSRHAAGASAAHIAQAYGLTERHVWCILSAAGVAPAPPRQTSLSL